MPAACRTCACMARRAVVAVFCVAGLSSLAQADSIRGDCRYNGETVRFSDGVVYREADHFDERRSDVVVGLATFAIDKNAMAATKQKSHEIVHQQHMSHGGRLLKLRFAGGKVTGLTYSGGDENFSIATRRFGTLQIRADDANHVDVGYVLDGDTDELRCKLDFDLAYATTTAVMSAGGGVEKSAAEGKALPPGGGEPGKIFQANLSAMRSGDFDAMLATVTQAQAAKMRAQKNDPDFAAMLAMMKAFAPTSANVTGGRDFGDRAELVIDAVDQSGAKATGTSTLRREGGQWKVDRTSMKSGR